MPLAFTIALAVLGGLASASTLAKNFGLYQVTTPPLIYLAPAPRRPPLMPDEAYVAQIDPSIQSTKRLP